MYFLCVSYILEIFYISVGYKFRTQIEFILEFKAQYKAE
jgi:hypothetical protein